MCFFKSVKFEMYPEQCRLSGGYDASNIAIQESLNKQQWAHKKEKEQHNKRLNNQARGNVAVLVANEGDDLEKLAMVAE